MEDDEDVRPTPRRYYDSVATARTPNDYNRGVQNATEAGVADNRRVLSELEEARSVQRRELAEEILNEFLPVLPFLASEPLRRGLKEGDAFDQIIRRLRTAVEDQRAEIRELRDALAEADRRSAEAVLDKEKKQDEDSRSSSLVTRLQKEIEQLKDQRAQDEEMIKYLQECRAREAQVIFDWKKDILLWLNRTAEERGTSSWSAPRLELPSYVRDDMMSRRPRSRRAANSFRADRDDPVDDYEPSRGGYYRDSRPPGSSTSWRVQEARLIEILEQGERMYDRIMETSAVIRKKLGQ